MKEKSLCTGEFSVVSPLEAFENYADMVYRLAFARTGNRSDADDVLQNVFLRLLSTSCRVQSEEHLKALLIRMTVNCSKNLLGSAWNKRTEGLDDSFSDEGIEHNDTFDAVMQLPVKYRTVIHLHYYCGYSVDEIAAILKCSSSAIKSRLMRARNKLKLSLKE